MRRAAGVLAAMGVASQEVVLDAPRGKVAAAVVERAQDDGADLIALGNQGLSDVASIVIGSVAHAVLRRAACLVLTCP